MSSSLLVIFFMHLVDNTLGNSDFLNVELSRDPAGKGSVSEIIGLSYGRRLSVFVADVWYDDHCCGVWYRLLLLLCKTTSSRYFAQFNYVIQIVYMSR